MNYNPYRQRTVTRDLALALVMTITIVFTTLAVVSYVLSSDRAAQQLDTRSADLTSSMAAVLGNLIWTVDVDAIEQVAEAYLNVETVVTVRIYDEHGLVLYEHDIAQPNDDLITHIEPIYFQGDRAVGQVELVVTKRYLQDAQREILFFNFMAMIILVIAIIGTTQLFLNRFLVRPIDDLQQGLHKIASGDYDYRLPTYQQEDIQAIARHVNGMVDQIAERDQRLRHWVNTLEHRVAERTQALEQALQETEGLFKAAQAILGATDLETICRNLILHFTALVQSSDMILYLVDHENEKVILQVHHGKSHITPLSYHDLKRGISGRVFATKEPVVSQHVDDGIEPEETKAVRIREQVGPLVVMPFVNKEQVIGTVTAINRVGERDFTPHDIELLSALATQAAAAIENVRLFKAAQEANIELESLNRDKDKFFSILAHDLRGPFMPLLGNTDLLVEMAENLPPDEVRQIGQAIRRSAKQIFDLLESLLTWSRLQMGRLAHNPETLNLWQLVDETITLLSPLAESKEILLRNQILPEQTVWADRHMLDMVIRNLTNNALKFTPRQGEITVVLNHSTNSPHFVEIQIRDTGVGIAADDLDKLFRLDTQHTTTGTAQEQGTGLGLIMCQEMIERHGGRIWITSTLGRGTTVHFIIPENEI